MSHSDQYLDAIISAQKAGSPAGIGSVCSAHPDVLQAVMHSARESSSSLLVESTCNQVNQYGGYTRMTATQFSQWLCQLADQVGFPHEHLIIGGDHLGPNVWKKEPVQQAMQKSHVLVADYVKAGYQKIHLDTSMPLGDDPAGQPLPPEVIASRTADLARTAEDAFSQLGIQTNYLRYVIGTEVPPPGGIQGDGDTIHVTTTEDVQETLDLTQRAFQDAGLQAAWQRVIAVVVHPGVEFGNEVIYEYDRSQTRALKQFIQQQKGIIYEAHSSDYQTRAALRELVQDHFAILKVGPGLTFAYREAVLALAMIESELLSSRGSHKPSGIMQSLEASMLHDPQHWQGYYGGSPEHKFYLRRFSFSDRIRYYWAAEPVQAAVARLHVNLSGQPIPLSLLSQYLPRQYQRVRSGQIANQPADIIRDAILAVWEDYTAACETG